MEATASDRVLTLPNAVTVVRLCLLPVFIYLLLVHQPRERYAAALVLAVMGSTDWVDGYLARHLNQISELGKVLDPVADRLLLIGGVGAILWDGSVPTWVAVVALGREAAVAATVLILAALGAARIDVTWWGKAGTFGLMVAFPLFLAGHSSAGWHHFAARLAWIAAIPGLGFGLYALVLYVPLARQALREGRDGRAAVHIS
ncbi:MAG: CDP-diacylglycerol--glycerol-3-phosphate 3-phosphatidyltransferase [Acidimicrobiales bacterium]